MNRIPTGCDALGLGIRHLVLIMLLHVFPPSGHASADLPAFTLRSAALFLYLHPQTSAEGLVFSGYPDLSG